MGSWNGGWNSSGPFDAFSGLSWPLAVFLASGSWVFFGAWKRAAKPRRKGLCGPSSTFVDLCGLKAEGKGLEPSTGYPAPDFESGC